jgi:hypothetical protein
LCLVGISSSPYRRAVDMNRIGASIVLANSVIFACGERGAPAL